jgi:collagen type III alpha
VPVEVRVIVGGESPQEVALHYTTKDRTFVEERLRLTPLEERPHEFQLLFAGETGAGLTQSVSYFITAGDAVSETYQLSVVLAPSATVDRVEYEYPAYTELEPRVQLTPPIDALEGTQVTLHADTGGVPVESAVVELLSSDTGRSAHEQIPMTITNGTQLRASWKLGFRNDGTYAREYRIRCQTAEGLSELDPARHPITIRPDVPPEVALLDPQGDLERPANAVIPLVFKARDPDFKVNYVTLRVEKDGEEIQGYPLFDGSKKVVVDRFRWELEPLRLQPGDVVSFYIEARDNKQPYGNRKTSLPLNLTIIDPVSPEDARRQQEQDEREQEPELREEQNQAAAENNEQPDEDGDPQADGSGQSSAGETSPDDPDKQEQSARDEAGPADEQPAKEGDSPEDRGEPGQDASQEGDSGENQQDSPGKGESPGDSEEQPSGAGEQTPSEDREPLRDDGTDDAEALEKLIDHQQREADRKRSSGDESSPEKPGEQEATPDPAAKDANQQPKQDDPGAGETPGEADPSGDEGGGKGPQQPDADSAKPDQSAPRQEKGDGTDPSEKPGDTPEGDPAEDPNQEPSPQREPASPEQKPAEKGTGEPDPGSKGRPDEKPDPDARRTDQEIEREPGTKPSTVPPRGPRETETTPEEKVKSDTPPGDRPRDEAPRQPKTGDPPPGGDPPDPGEGDPQGQKSQQPDSGEKGGSQQATQGTPDQEGTGTGDQSEKPGDSPQARDESQKPGQPGDKDQAAERSDPSQSGDKATPSGDRSDDGGGGAGEGESGEDGAGTPAPGDNTGTGGGSETPPSGAAAPGTGQGIDTDRQPGSASPAGPEPGNLEDAKAATDLILKRLEEDLQRGEVDPDLLRELGWTESQLQTFADRMRRQLESGSRELSFEDQLKQRQFEEMLKNMNFNPDVTQAEKRQLPRRATDSFGARRMPVPLEHREAFEAFTRELSRQKQN